MSREAQFVARMEEDVPLMGILTGGVYAAEELGPEGITRDSAPGAFDVDGFLKPVALVRQRSNTPDGVVRDQEAQATSTAEVVEIYLYADRGYGQIDAAKSRLYALFQDYQFSDSFPVEWIGTIGRQREEGALAGASMERMEFIVYSVREGA